MSILEKEQNRQMMIEGLTELNSLQGTPLALSRSILIIVEAIIALKVIEPAKKTEDKEIPKKPQKPQKLES